MVSLLPLLSVARMKAAVLKVFPRWGGRPGGHAAMLAVFPRCDARPVMPVMLQRLRTTTTAGRAACLGRSPAWCSRAA